MEQYTALLRSQELIKLFINFLIYLLIYYCFIFGNNNNFEIDIIYLTKNNIYYLIEL